MQSLAIVNKPNKMHLVVVGVCTYKRPRMLEECIQSLLSQIVPDNIIMQIVVIDNDEFMSGHQAFCRATHLSGAWTYYLWEPDRGIAHARNKAIDWAIEQKASYLCFVDDDETADENWLAGLMHSEYIDIPIVSGWNIIDYPPDFPEWARDRLKNREEGSQSVTGAGNIRLSSDVFEKFRFETKLGLGGGEDGELLMRARKANIEMRFTKRALTYEFAHPERYTVRGILNRSYWIAAANMREEMLKYGKWIAIRKRALAIIFCLPTALIQLLHGLIYYPFNQGRSIKKLLRSCKTVAVTLGRLATIYGHIPQTYAKTVGQ